MFLQHWGRGEREESPTKDVPCAFTVNHHCSEQALLLAAQPVVRLLLVTEAGAGPWDRAGSHRLCAPHWHPGSAVLVLELEGREGFMLTRQAAETAGELTGGLSFQEEGHAGFPKSNTLSSYTISQSRPHDDDMLSKP